MNKNFNMMNMMHIAPMNNFMMNNNNFFNNGQLNQINLDFYNKSKGHINIQCSMKDKVSEIIQKYRVKANDFDDTKAFKFNIKLISQNSLETFEDLLIKKDYFIFVKSEINVIFRKSGINEDIIPIQCSLEDKVSYLINKYRVEADDFAKEKKFIFNAILLHESETIKEAGIGNNSIIYVTDNRGVKGG